MSRTPTVPDPAARPPLNYEQARDELAEVVGRLEQGGLTLDESLALWERGEQLAGICETLLAGARERVEAALAAADDAPGDAGSHDAVADDPDDADDQDDEEDD